MLARLTKLLVVACLALGLSGTASAQKPWTGTCSISPIASPGFFAFTVTGIVAQPGHYLLFEFSGPAPTNPPSILISDAAGATQTLYIGYTTPGTYSVIRVWNVNDKGGNGGSDGGGSDTYSIVATNACSASLP
jgi:hypothetical protein